MTAKKIFFKTLLFTVLFCTAESGFSQVKYQVYADYVYLFAKNTVFPQEKDSGNFVIGVIGKEDLYVAIQNIAFTKKLNGRNIVVKQFSDVKHTQNCHILFIDSNQKSELHLATTLSKKMHILLVTENVYEDKNGVTVNFVTDQEGIKFELNGEAAKQQHLKINTDLYRFAAVRK